MELQRLYVSLMLDASDFKTGMAAVTGAVGIAAAAATAAVAAVAIDGVKAAADMEQQMADIADNARPVSKNFDLATLLVNPIKLPAADPHGFIGYCQCATTMVKPWRKRQTSEFFIFISCILNQHRGARSCSG